MKRRYHAKISLFFNHPPIHHQHSRMFVYIFTHILPSCVGPWVFERPSYFSSFRLNRFFFIGGPKANSFLIFRFLLVGFYCATCPVVNIPSPLGEIMIYIVYHKSTYNQE